MIDIIASVAFKKAYKEVVEYLKSKTLPALKINLGDVDNVYLKAANVENVKTIWQVDKKINLNEFYYPSKINVEQNIISVDSLEDFPENGKIIIQGMAGQGKSIFLRYLVAKQLKIGTKIPIFIELRKISKSITLESLINESILDLGININITHMEYIFKSNKFTLILDAFDEIPASEVKATLTYLESLCLRYYMQQIIISSRPFSDIQMVTYFSVYDLAPLSESDFKPFLSKLFDNKITVVNDIISAIYENSTDIKQLLTTPLLLTLLTITYKSYNRVPSHLHEFYENLFHLLINRHDSTKPGFRREFISGLNEREMEELFSSFSFYCMKEDNDSLTKRDAIRTVSKAMNLVNIDNVSENDFLTDCVKNTSLIIEEGFNYYFVHKSIREYHAASFIKYSSFNLKEKFYAAAIINSKRYVNELFFLSIIDKHLYNTLFLIPLYKSIFNSLSYNEVAEEVNISCFDNIEVVADDDYGNVVSINFDGVYNIDSSYFGVDEKIYTIIISNFHKIDFKKKASSYKLKDIDMSECVRDKIKHAILEWCVSNHLKYMELRKMVEKEEKIIKNLDF